MKIVTIEIEDVDYREVRPYIDKVKYNRPLESIALSDMDTIPMNESTFTKETYPLERFAVGKQYEEFYIRNKDKAAFKQMVDGLIKESKVSLLNKIEGILYDFTKYLAEPEKKLFYRFGDVLTNLKEVEYLK